MNRVLNGRSEVLLVDDSDGDVALFQKIMSRQNPEAVVHTISSGEEVLNYMRKRSAASGTPNLDLVIIDLNLPRKGGLEVLKEIKSDQELREVPVVVFTGSGSADDERRANELGASGYLVKPVAFEELSKMVEMIDSYWLSRTRPPPVHD